MISKKFVQFWHPFLIGHKQNSNSRKMDYGGSQHILTAYYVIFQLQLELLHEDMKVKFERCKKIFSMFLIIVILFGILPVSALQGTVSDSTTSRIVKEIVEMREESVKYFICEDGSYIAATYSSPVHYEESG